MRECRCVKLPARSVVSGKDERSLFFEDDFDYRVEWIDGLLRQFDF
jgi:hypothetical protein